MSVCQNVDMIRKCIFPQILFSLLQTSIDISVLRHLGYATTETCNSILHGITVFLIRNQKNIDQKITQPETTPEVLTKISAEKRVPNFGTQKENMQKRKNQIIMFCEQYQKLQFE